MVALPRTADGTPYDRRLGGLRNARAPIDVVAQCAVAGLFQIAVPLLVKVRPRIDPRARLTPHTLIVFTHKRDLDIPVLAAALLGPHAWPRWLGRVTFIGSADLFIDGFLGYYFPQLGRPLRAVLARGSIRPVLRALRVVPVGQSGPRLVAQWLDDLRAIYSDHTLLGSLLSDSGFAYAAEAGLTDGATLAEARQWRYERLLARQLGAEFLDSAALGRLRLHEARQASRTLATVGAALQAGGIALISPEGQLSPDGALQPFRSGFSHLLRFEPRTVVLPVGITYDLLAGGRRPRLFLTAGAPLAGLGALHRREAEQQLRGVLSRLCTVTLAHIIACLIFDDLDGERAIGRADLRDRAWQEAQRLASAGQRLDAALAQPHSFGTRFAVLLREARGHGLNLRDDGAILLDWALLRRPVRGWQENPLGYAFNEARSLPAWSADAR